MNRLTSFVAGAALSLAAVISASSAEQPFSFETVQARAKALAEKPYAPPRGEVPEWLRRLTYDELRLIEFNGKQSLWFKEKLPFMVQYLHPGFLFDKTVHLHQVSGGRSEPIPYRREYFNYRTLKTGDTPETMGFAGFRIMFPFPGHGPDHNELGSFAGASYFRFLTSEAAYGLSARGLAIDSGEPTPEEFPIFTEFWLEKPDVRAKTFNVYALMDSESVAGAYKFSITPGTTTMVQVKTTIYCRKNPKVFGVAPLTSMFWHGENSDTARDFRPEVHDSDGLLMQTGAGEWLWRPLVNPRHVRVAAFSDENPRAFGLLQRDRNFENYQDLEASYHARPSTWVEPVGKWGKGSVRLLEIPTSRETDDNIVAFWVPDTLPAPGEPVELEYKLHWFMDQIGPPAGFVRSTRHGKSAHYEPGFERFVIDFDGAKLRTLKEEEKPRKGESKVEHVVDVSGGGTLHHSSLQKNKINGTWRVAFTVKPDGSGKPVELRCFLRKTPDTLTETWTYLWQP